MDEDRWKMEDRFAGKRVEANGIGNAECGMRKSKEENRGKWNWEMGMRNAECGKVKKRTGANGIRNWECGLRPLRAVGSIYEPEAIGAYAYAPAGRRKIKAKEG